MGQIRVGVVGVGGNSGTKLHCEPLAGDDRAKLVAVCDQSPERANLARDRFHVPTYTAYDEFLTDTLVDVVTIATPPFLHAEMAIAALRAGKHVVVEKPMCLSVGEADAMIAAAKESGRILTVFQNRRWDADYLAIRQLVDDGAVGDPWTIESRFASGPAYGTPEFHAAWFQEVRYGGGWLLGWGSHLFDQVLRMVPSCPKTVFCVARSTVWSKEADDYFKTIIVFDNGMTAQVEATINDRMNLPRWYVRGSKGSLRKQTVGRDSPVEISQLVPGTANGEFTGATRFVDVHSFAPAAPSVSQLYYSLLAESILDGKDLAVKAAESRMAMAVIEASFRSSREGTTVTLE